MKNKRLPAKNCKYDSGNNFWLRHNMQRRIVAKLEELLPLCEKLK
jgi:hypothetical protein